MTADHYVSAMSAAAMAALATVLLLRWRARLPQAAPNPRSLHTAAIPRVGGLAIWFGWLPLAAMAPASTGMDIAVWGIPWALLVAVSLFDDWRAVAVVPRLTVHAVAAFGFAWMLFARDAGATPVPLATVLAAAVVIAWSLNLYNFMDGSDGLAAAMALVGFTAYAVAATHAGWQALILWELAAATLPVFVANRPPARIFLGDVGAVPLGFLAAAFGVAGVHAAVWPAWFPVLVFLPFIADSTVTLIRRVMRGERFWEAHKTHYYQRMLLLGAGHRGTLAAHGALMLGTAGTAVACVWVAPTWGAAALGAWCVIHALVFATIDYHWRKNSIAAQ